MTQPLFDNQPIRRLYEEATDIWWFSVIDIVKFLTQQPDATIARKYLEQAQNKGWAKNEVNR